jgi:hypothetical protein
VINQSATSTKSLIMSFSEKYSTIADQVAAAASVSFELQAQNEKVYLLHATSSDIEACVLTRRLQVAEFVTEVDALHSELERLENSARVNSNAFFLLCLPVANAVTASV